jgi:hypothetical protein
MDPLLQVLESRLAFPRSGEITDPWPVPRSSTVTSPSSKMPALSHFWISRVMRLSPTLCFTKRISHSWLTAPKKFWMSASICLPALFLDLWAQTLETA